ncbi:hypothetical protein [Komarekiella delphini-convector]|uniref:hypothetical protein n=1 Tax=Komarekiella delphini-convector TaxID=3050158 RepID=UPI001CD89C8C|nr:hypothetical protein [Komarekiella delphini-convector]
MLSTAKRNGASDEILSYGTLREPFTSLREAPPTLCTLRERCANTKTNHTLTQ